jgi:sugar lactone lactonase YvrE
MPAELIVDARNAVGECPVWVAEENALYWVDIPAGGLQRWSAAPAMSRGKPRKCSPASPVTLGQLGRRHGERLLPAAPAQRRQPRQRRLASIEHSRPDMRLNDGRCDRQGRFWAGSMVLDMGANAAEADSTATAPGNAAQAQLDGFIVPNGLASARTVARCTCPTRIRRAADLGLRLRHRQRHAEQSPAVRRHESLPGRPDGAAVDAEGCYWICANDAG